MVKRFIEPEIEVDENNLLRISELQQVGKKDEDSPPARPSSKFDSAKPAFNDGITIGQIADHRSIGRLPGGNNMGNNPRPARKGIVIYKLLFVSCRCKNVGKVERTNRKTKSKNQQTGLELKTMQ